ncbi:MAG TPA: hypothetical protein VJ646_15275, partial [Candidatus Binatia bacterium]|nr:hypothetical protein [Candidatus Binatia bacterium]
MNATLPCHIGTEGLKPRHNSGGVSNGKVCSTWEIAAPYHGTWSLVSNGQPVGMLDITKKTRAP